jgi:hypothetical protein
VMGQQVKRGKDNPLVGQGIKPAFQIGTLPANAIRASRIKRLHKQAVYKTANLRWHFILLKLAFQETSI